MFSTTWTPRPQPTVLLSTAVPVCGSLVDHSVRGRGQVGSIPTTPTKDAVMGSEVISFATVAVIAANGTNDRRATKRGEQANADN